MTSDWRRPCVTCATLCARHEWKSTASPLRIVCATGCAPPSHVINSPPPKPPPPPPCACGACGACGSESSTDIVRDEPSSRWPGASRPPPSA
eukprot:scaffold89202_cov69-Phaeocystis_antarctica.AAC.9